MGLLVLVGIILSILIPNLIYHRILKGEERTVTNRTYGKTFLLASTIYMIPIIVIQLSFDAILKVDNYNITTIGQCFFHAFVRAAILEEGAKFYFTRRLLMRRRELGMKEAVLLAGVIGIGFGFLEKLVAGEGALILNAFFPGHMLFQWIMGYYIYRAIRAEGSEQRKLMVMSYLVPMVVHGLWDLGLFFSDILMLEEGSARMMVGLALVLFMVVIYATCLIKGMRTVRKLPV